VIGFDKKTSWGGDALRSSGGFGNGPPSAFDYKTRGPSALTPEGAFQFAQNVVTADEMMKPPTPPPMPPMQPGTAAMAGVQSGIGAPPAAGGVGIAQGAFGPSFNSNIGVQHPANNIPFLRMFGQGG
jgi:hypothetical protein